MKKITAAILSALMLLTTVCFANPFSDVEGHWAASEIETAYNSGIVNGDDDGSFRPDDGVSRAEFVKMLAAVVASNYLQPIPDDLAETTHWASKYYVFAKNLIYQPLTDAEKVGNIVPGLLTETDIDAPIQRWEMAFMVGEVFENMFYVEEGADYADAAQVSANYPAAVAESVGICVNVGIIKGDEHGNFNAGDGGTRAEAAAIMNRMNKKIQELISQNY